MNIGLIILIAVLVVGASVTTCMAILSVAEDLLSFFQSKPKS
jgi:hypothetical protein